MSEAGTALVTGTTPRLGGRLVLELAPGGIRVLVQGRDPSRVERVVEKLMGAAAPSER